MNDWSYGCVAKWLATAIAEAATRPTATAIGPRVAAVAQRMSRLRRGPDYSADSRSALRLLARCLSRHLQRRQHVVDHVVGMLEAA